ncbi:hypothetical protein G6F68_018809 [Rhizopus microsporus]|nr:hypothetical protein G6F68_018809 [Rhizopus microsporus]
MEASSASVFGWPGGFDWLNNSVAIGPGATVFTVLPSAASSSAQVRVMPASPALDAPYTVRPPLPSAARLPMLTPRP